VRSAASASDAGGVASRRAALTQARAVAARLLALRLNACLKIADRSDEVQLRAGALNGEYELLDKSMDLALGALKDDQILQAGLRREIERVINPCKTILRIVLALQQARERLDDDTTQDLSDLSSNSIHESWIAPLEQALAELKPIVAGDGGLPVKDLSGPLAGLAGTGRIQLVVALRVARTELKQRTFALTEALIQRFESEQDAMKDITAPEDIRRRLEDMALPWSAAESARAELVDCDRGLIGRLTAIELPKAQHGRLQAQLAGLFRKIEDEQRNLCFITLELLNSRLGWVAKGGLEHGGARSAFVEDLSRVLQRLGAVSTNVTDWFYDNCE
jgi:hypothetical protein